MTWHNREGGGNPALGRLNLAGRDRIHAMASVVNGLRALVAAAAVLAAAGSAMASETACPQHYEAGQAPDILKEGLAARLAEVCREGFGVLHSGVSATPLWSAERLTAERVRAAKGVDRVDRFHPEEELGAADRAELSHYRGSGFDRGHLAPAGDMATETSKDESFSLANIFPQVPELNRNLWAHIEATARGLALAYGEAYVVTGVAFGGNGLRRIGGRVLVPSAVYKAIYVPSASAAAVWWSPNAEPGDAYEVISVAELARRAGVDVFPGLDEAVKERGARLPAPSAYADRIPSSGRASATQGEANSAPAYRAVPAWERLARKALREMVK